MVRYMQAEKDYSIAEFYRRTGHEASAWFYYDLVRRRYGETEFHDKAIAHMKEINADLAAQQQQAEWVKATHREFNKFVYGQDTPTLAKDQSVPAVPGVPELSGIQRDCRPTSFWLRRGLEAARSNQPANPLIPVSGQQTTRRCAEAINGIRRSLTGGKWERSHERSVEREQIDAPQRAGRVARGRFFVPRGLQLGRAFSTYSATPRGRITTKVSSPYTCRSSEIKRSKRRLTAAWKSSSTGPSSGKSNGKRRLRSSATRTKPTPNCSAPSSPSRKTCSTAPS